MAKQTAHPAGTQGGTPKAGITLDDIYEAVFMAMEDFINFEKIDSVLTGKERMRLMGAGVRNYGFIDKAWDIGHDNFDFLPPNFNITQMGANLRELEALRQLSLTLEKFQAAVNECLLIKGTELYRDALRIYASLREQARNRVPGAEALYRALLTFFRRRRTPNEEEPTIKELERDFHKLLHGTADGEIIIENERPRITGGTRKVVDDVHKGTAAIKETKELSEKE